MYKHEIKIIIDMLLRIAGDKILTVQERWDLLSHLVLELTGENINDIMTHSKSAHKLRLKRGTTTENDAYTGPAGELTMDTDTNTLRIHDGTTPGGIALARAADIPSGADSETPTPTLPENIDYVVEWQTPTAENNYTWYRKYASGWVEQGGITTTTSGTLLTINLPIELLNLHYDLQVTPIYKRNDVSAEVTVSEITTNSFTVWGGQAGAAGYWAVPFSWMACAQQAAE